MKKLKCFSLFFLFAYCLYSQSIGIGTTNPNGSAQVDISSSGKGLLIPRMTTVLINSISNPAKGLMVYDSTKNQLMVNMGTAAAPNWQTIVSNSGWNLTGNSASDPINHFIGTTDNGPLQFRINNQFAGKIDSVSRQTFLGYGAGKNITSNAPMTAIGFKALYSNTSGAENTAYGYMSLYSNTIGFDNTAIGYQALYSNTSGIDNIAVGHQALYSNTTGIENSAYGFWALNHNTTGSDNYASGSYALFYNTAGDFNTASGYSSLYLNSSGMYNTAFGYEAGRNTTTARYNTSVGYRAGRNYDMGYNNTLLGANCDITSDGLFNCIAIGQFVTVNASSQARIGNSATNSIGGYANWTNISDGRFKKDIQDGVKGIDFIMKLRPVTYHLDVEGISKSLNEDRGSEMDTFSKQAIAEKEEIVFSGFVAQEVEQAAQESSYEFSGVDKPKNEKDFYGLRYAEFVVPLVKAMQEQQQVITDLQRRIGLLEEQNKILMQLINKKN